MEKEENICAESLAILQRETSTSKAAYKNWKASRKNTSSMKWNADSFEHGFSATGNEWRSSYASQFDETALSKAPRTPLHSGMKNKDHFEIDAEICTRHSLYGHEFTQQQHEDVDRISPKMRASDNNVQSADETIRVLQMENLELKRALKWYKQQHAKLTG